LIERSGGKRVEEGEGGLETAEPGGRSCALSMKEERLPTFKEGKKPKESRLARDKKKKASIRTEKFEPSEGEKGKGF